MNVLQMRVFNILFAILFLACITLSCKRPTPVEEVLSKNCRLNEFTQFGVSYAFEYDSRNLPTVMSRVNGGGPGYTTLFFDYKDERLSTIAMEINGSKYPKTKFEYQDNNLIRIQNFDAERTVNGTAVNVELKESIDFLYDFGDKPTGLIRWFVDEKGQLYKSHESIFKYDANNNLVSERMHVFARQNVLEADYLYEYFYDEKPNTRRPLHYIFFFGMESAPSMFSANNMKRLTIAYDGKTFRNQTFGLAYDSNGNVIDDAYQYSNIKWTCE